MFYLLFIIGKSKGEINNLSDLNKVVKRKFDGEIINITDRVANTLSVEIFNNDYSEQILLGAKEVLNW